MAETTSDKPGTGRPATAHEPAGPRLGDRVLYRLTRQDAAWVNVQLTEARRAMQDWPMGNRARPGDTCPMDITHVFDGGLVNGQVLLDGSFTLWATSIPAGEDLGQYGPRPD